MRCLGLFQVCISKSFVLSVCHSIFVLNQALSIYSPSVIHWISKLFIDLIHILFHALFAAVDKFSNSKNLQHFIKTFRALTEDFLSGSRGIPGVPLEPTLYKTSNTQSKIQFQLNNMSLP